jgi:hypothetical protein
MKVYRLTEEQRLQIDTAIDLLESVLISHDIAVENVLYRHHNIDGDRTEIEAAREEMVQAQEILKNLQTISPLEELAAQADD